MPHISVYLWWLWLWPLWICSAVPSADEREHVHIKVHMPEVVRQHTQLHKVYKYKHPHHHHLPPPPLAVQHTIPPPPPPPEYHYYTPRYALAANTLPKKLPSHHELELGYTTAAGTMLSDGTAAGMMPGGVTVDGIMSAIKMAAPAAGAIEANYGTALYDNAYSMQQQHTSQMNKIKPSSSSASKQLLQQIFTPQLMTAITASGGSEGIMSDSADKPAVATGFEGFENSFDETTNDNGGGGGGGGNFADYFSSGKFIEKHRRKRKKPHHHHQYHHHQQQHRPSQIYANYYKQQQTPYFKHNNNAARLQNFKQFNAADYEQSTSEASAEYYDDNVSGSQQPQDNSDESREDQQDSAIAFSAANGLHTIETVDNFLDNVLKPMPVTQAEALQSTISALPPLYTNVYDAAMMTTQHQQHQQQQQQQQQPSSSLSSLSSSQSQKQWQPNGGIAMPTSFALQQLIKQPSTSTAFGASAYRSSLPVPVPIRLNDVAAMPYHARRQQQRQTQPQRKHQMTTRKKRKNRIKKRNRL